MKLFSTISLLPVLMLGLLNVSARSQLTGSRLELLHADVSRGIVQDGVPLKILQGNVHARQDTLELFCDRAVYNERSSVIHLQGHLRMYRGKDTLLAREARYFEESKIAIAEGDVKVFRPSQTMKCDYLEYYYTNEQIRATGNLFLHDEENDVFITADRGEYLPDSKYSYVRSNSHFWRIDSTSRDTLHIYSRQMEYHFGLLKRAIARDSVEIFQDNLRAYCDSAIYQIEEDIIFLESSPRAVQENNRMSGERMQLILMDRELEQIKITGNAIAISSADSLLEKENKLEGREIIMYIEDRELKSIYAISNARSFYFLKEKEEERGINVASADTIKAFLLANELDSIAVIGGARGTYYPENYKGKIVEE